MIEAQEITLPPERQLTQAPPPPPQPVARNNRQLVLHQLLLPGFVGLRDLFPGLFLLAFDEFLPQRIAVLEENFVISQNGYI